MMLELRAGANGLVLDPGIGNIADLWFGAIMPLHRAPWYGTRDGDRDMAPVERRLAGDFLCMPFGASEPGGGPIHGPTANAPWDVIELEPHRARLRLSVPAMGARVEKELRLSAGAPLLTQIHSIEGGQGRVTLAHHPMVHMAAGGRIACSAKRAALVAAEPLEPGRNLLAPGQRAGSLAELRGRDGGQMDLGRYPSAPGEDFVTLVEAEGSPLGWTAVTRAAEGDVVFVLKDPAVLPVTMLWISNGGRDAAPWNGRHCGVLGIEDGVAAGPLGHRAALGRNPVAAEGVPTALELGPRHQVRLVIGAIPKPKGWATVAGIRAEAGSLVLTGDDGSEVALEPAAGFP